MQRGAAKIGAPFIQWNIRHRHGLPPGDGYNAEQFSQAETT